MNRIVKAIVHERSTALAKSDKSMKSIYDVIFSSPDKVLGEYSDGYRIYTVTYGQADERIHKLAKAINSRVGASHKYVGLDMDNCVEWIIAFWAILMSGNKPYLVNRRFPASLTNGVAETLEIQYFIGTGRDNCPCEYLLYSELEKIECDGLNCVFENEIALSTSATSLNEVICIYTGTEIAEQIMNTEYVLSRNKSISCFYNGSLKQLAFLPFYHVFGLFAVYFWFSIFGCCFVFLKDYSGDGILKTCRKHQVTHLFAVPLFWQTVESQVKKNVARKGEKTEKKFYKGLKLCETVQSIFPYMGRGISNYIMRSVTRELFGKSIRFCISGGNSLKDSTLGFFNALGYPLHNGYGMTETGITSVELGKRASQRNKNSVGKPFPSVKYRIDNNGVICIKGSSLCRYTIVNKVVTERGEWFNTGDVAEEDSDGRYYICGRKKDVIITAGGENINPDILEKYFDIPFSQRFCIFSSEQSGNEAVAIVVELKKYCSAEMIHKTASAVKLQNNGVPMSMRITEMYFSEDLIASPQAIKISRQYLRKAISDGRIRLIPFDSMTEAHADKSGFDISSPLAVKMIGIISQVLSVPEQKILPDANILLDLGGSSLDYFAVLAQIKEQFGVTLYLDENRCCYTLREFCREIEENHQYV